jgi:hypothetical protein
MLIKLADKRYLEPGDCTHEQSSEMITLLHLWYQAGYLFPAG